MAILVIEDDDGLRQSLTELLRDEDYEVHAAQDGVEALNWLERHEPSLILLDLMLPWINGVDFSRQLRLNPRFTKTPIVIVSARPDVSQRARDAQADDWLSKPMSFELLLHVVQNLAVTRVGNPGATIEIEDVPEPA
jgi:two-component system response regulator MprA